MDIKVLITKIKTLPDCIVYSPKGIPNIEKGHVIPSDLKQFYELCGGIELYKNGEYPIKILSPEKVERANPIIIGEVPDIPNNGIPEGDISENWYVVAEDYNGDYLTIDLRQDRLGRCYDSFHEVHPGNSPIIARSFTDLVESLIDNKGQRWYWLKDGFVSLGEAYDDVNKSWTSVER